MGVRRIDFNLTQASEKISSLFAATLAVELAGLSCAILERPTRMRRENQSTEGDRSPLTFTDLVLLISARLLAWALKSILLLFAVVFLVAMVLNPIVAFLQRRRIHRGLAVALLALALVAVFALALSFLIPPLLTQVDELIRQTPKAWNRVQAQVQAFGQRYPSIQQAIPDSGQGFGHRRCAGR